MYHSDRPIDDLLSRLPAEGMARLLALGQPAVFRRGEHLLHAGEPCRYLYKVERGILRTYRCWGGDPANEITSGFSFPGDFDTSPSSFVMQQPSVESIQAVLDAEVVCFGYEELTQLRRGDPAVGELILYALADYMAATEQVLFDMRVLSARQRYDKLLAEHPDYVQQIPLKYLASFLNMKVETLSRVRR
ncbi:MAG: Crp/Fnr family transcriptional regulator [Bacteroidia bacterium]|nr:Crp/Fnr family transcriptional regulator [Bacteroidia bacterium]